MTDQQTTPPSQPTAEELARAGEVSQATADAAAAAPNADQARTDAAAAARKAAERVNLEIPEEQIKLIANGVVNAMEARGAFDPPVEPIAPPPAAPPAPGEEPAATPPAAPVEQAPKKRTFAQRFLGE
jgi:hypothetical protein